MKTAIAERSYTKEQCNELCDAFHTLAEAMDGAGLYERAKEARRQMKWWIQAAKRTASAPVVASPSPQIDVL